MTRDSHPIKKNRHMRIQIIDKKSKKRLQKGDPLKKQASIPETTKEGESPMDPPTSYAPSTVEKVEIKDMAPLLKDLIKEHNHAKKALNKFEKVLHQLKEDKWKINQEINKELSEFFHFFDHQIMAHNRVEEKTLFPLLHQRLLENGEHATDKKQTAIDLMEDDHILFIQLGTLTFNLIGIASRLSADNDKNIVFEMAYQNGLELIENLRLHIYREDETLFPLAHQLISEEEFKTLLEQAQNLS